MFDENLSHISGAARLTSALLILIHSLECSKYPAPCRKCSKESLAYLLRSQVEIFFLKESRAYLLRCQTHVCTPYTHIYTGIRCSKEACCWRSNILLHSYMYYFFFQTHMCTSHGVPRSDASNFSLYIYIYMYIQTHVCTSDGVLRGDASRG